MTLIPAAPALVKVGEVKLSTFTKLFVDGGARGGAAKVDPYRHDSTATDSAIVIHMYTIPIWCSESLPLQSHLFMVLSTSPVAYMLCIVHLYAPYTQCRVGKAQSDGRAAPDYSQGPLTLGTFRKSL